MNPTAATALVAAVAAAAVVTAVVAASDEETDSNQVAFEACAEAEDVDLKSLRQAPRASAEAHPGYPTSNLVVLLLPDPAGSAHCYFRAGEDGSLTLLGSSSD